MSIPVWKIVEGQGPLVAAAIHDGHFVRPEALELMAIPEVERLREEDPYTWMWTAVAPTSVVGLNSRFEVDLNRPRHKAVYIRPEDAWGLQVWREEPPASIIEGSRLEYDGFYAALEELLVGIERRYGRFVVFDLHTYNHRREGPEGPEADPEFNPQVNLGTGTVNREIWGPLVDRFVADLSGFDFPGGGLDVRENVKFRGGAMSRWIHERFPETGCSLAIEFKKFFMDEWTGKLDEKLHQSIFEALRATTLGVTEELANLALARPLPIPAVNPLAAVNDGLEPLRQDPAEAAPA